MSLKTIFPIALSLGILQDWAAWPGNWVIEASASANQKIHVEKQWVLVATMLINSCD